MNINCTYPNSILYKNAAYFCCIPVCIINAGIVTLVQPLPKDRCLNGGVR